MHKRFEEWCALAVMGQLSPEAAVALEEHARCCRACKEFLADAGTLRGYIEPMLLPETVAEATPPEGMRERFLRRAAEQGLTLTPGPAMTGASEPANEAKRAISRNRMRTARIRWQVLIAHPGMRMAGLAAMCLCLAAIYATSRWHAEHTATQPHAMASTARVSATVAASVPGTPDTANDTHLEALKARLGVLKESLDKARARNAELTRTVNTLSAQAERDKSVAAQLQQAQEQQGATEQRAAALEAERDNLSGQLAAAHLALGEQRNVVAEANDRLARMQAELERRQQYGQNLATAQEMISSRNLHIIDIYDNDASNRARQLSGRVFYVEGKSLVFYAYDLPDARRKSRDTVFRVWGETAGTRTPSYQLGVMRKETNGKGRWVLSFNDPKVLTRINAVYVSTDSPTLAPENSHRLMYAFLGNANHP
ncbi:hypothetical protein ACOBR2_14770 [Telmatobacter bradus]|uniref:hypothetical protein n=1 Tax=Telmatobacter bradus TaxID=474953 RepID=UPI003B429CC9